MSLAAPVTAAAVIRQAISTIGIHEDPPGSNHQPFGKWYGMDGVAWCAIWVSFTEHHAGWDGFAITSTKGYSYCPDGVAFAKSHGAWLGPDDVPSIGDIAFFDFGEGRPSHTGLVEIPRVSPGTVGTIEGNTNDAGGRTGGIVMRHNRTKAGGLIGFMHIDYLSEEDDNMDDATIAKLAEAISDPIVKVVTDAQASTHRDNVALQGLVQSLVEKNKP